MPEWLLVLPLTPSLNEVLRQHHYALPRLKREWWWWIKSAAMAAGVPTATRPRKLVLTRFGPRELDYDNLVGGAKHLVLDLLRPQRDAAGVHVSGRKKGQRWFRSTIGTGLIVDDSPKWLSVTYNQARPAKGTAPRTELLLSDLDGDS